MKIKFVKQDQWIGHYYDNNFHYVCLIPCVVLMWRKKKIKRAADDFDLCVTCKGRVPRGSGSHREGGKICYWCEQIESNSCLHFNTKLVAPMDKRQRRSCTRCRAIQYVTNR